MQLQKALNGHLNERDMIEAFCSLGGNDDRTGTVSSSALQSVCEDFELTIDIQELVSLYDTDNSGFIDFEEFSSMLTDHEAEKNSVDKK